MYNVLSDKALLSERIVRSCHMCEINRSHQEWLQATFENMNWAKSVLTASKREQVTKSGLEVDYIHEKASCNHGSDCLIQVIEGPCQPIMDLQVFRDTTSCALVLDRTFEL